MKELKDFADSDISDKEVIDDITGKYRGMSEDKLIEQLLELVKKSRQDGTFSDSRLDEFIALVSPQLDERGKKRLSELNELIREKKS